MGDIVGREGLQNEKKNFERHGDNKIEAEIY